MSVDGGVFLEVVSRSVGRMQQSIIKRMVLTTVSMPEYYWKFYAHTLLGNKQFVKYVTTTLIL